MLLLALAILVVLLGCLSAAICLTSPLIITIANLFTTKFADFNLQIELQKLDGSVDTSLPWLIRRSTSPATCILNGVKPRFSRIFTKSSPNYVDIIAQRDREIAQLRRITANQVARIELLETRNAELEKINTPPIDPNAAQQATQIAERDTKISSLTATTVRQAEVEVQLRKELADEKAIFEQKTRGQPTTVRSLRARAAQLSWENRVLKQEVDTLEEDVDKITVHSRNNIVNFEATKKELEKRVSSRERDSKEADVRAQQAEAKLQAELERSKIERQKEAEKVQMTIRSLQQQLISIPRQAPIVIRESTNNSALVISQRSRLEQEKKVALDAKDEVIKSLEIRLETQQTEIFKLRAGADDALADQNQLCKSLDDTQKELLSTNSKLKEQQRLLRISLSQEQKTKKCMIEKTDMNIKQASRIRELDAEKQSQATIASAKMQGLKREVDELQHANDELESYVEDLEANQSNNDPSPVQDQAKTSENFLNNGTKALEYELQAQLDTMTTRVQYLERVATADKDHQTSLQFQIDELSKANGELRQRLQSGASCTGQAHKSKVEELADMEIACRKLLSDKVDDAQARVNTVLAEKGQSEQRLRAEAAQREQELIQHGNKLWTQKEAQLNTQLEQADITITALQTDVARLEDQKKATKVRTDDERTSLLKGNNMLYREVDELKLEKIDLNKKLKTAESGKKEADEAATRHRTQAEQNAVALAEARKARATTTNAASERVGIRANELLEESAHHRVDKNARKLVEELWDSNVLLKKIEDVVRDKGRMTRHNNVETILLDCQLNEENFDDIDKYKWPKLYNQLNDTQWVYDELYKILEDLKQLRWQDICSLLTKPRPSEVSAGASDHVEDESMGNSDPVPAGKGNVPSRIIDPSFPDADAHPAGGFSEPSQNTGHTPIDPALRDTVPINKQQPHNAALPGLYPNDNPPIFNSAVWNQNNSFTFNYMNNTPSKGRAVKGLGSLASMDKRRFTQKPKRQGS
ncbi:hypothetical protein ABVK25_007703 [Lepraria finkii]|uniref:Uncharacterized protein n=1 Tax=Lepraria finkii TaxID=1340010 RepID=A0ABR4B4R2_9LECA